MIGQMAAKLVDLSIKTIFRLERFKDSNVPAIPWQLEPYTWRPRPPVEDGDLERRLAVLADCHVSVFNCPSILTGGYIFNNNWLEPVRDQL